MVAHRTRDAHTNLSAQPWPETRSNVSRRDLLALCETSRINPINQIKKIDHFTSEMPISDISQRWRRPRRNATPGCAMPSSGELKKVYIKPVDVNFSMNGL